MRVFINILGILFGVVFFFNTEICDYFFNYSINEQKMSWILLRFRMYESVLFFLSLIIIIQSKNKFAKMIFTFVLVMIFFSLFDKLVFKINHYSYTDILSIFIATITSAIVFHKYQNKIE